MIEQVENEVIEEVETAEEVEDDTPKGFLSLEAYTEKGGDPDMYRGKKAFAQFYEKSQETKASNAAFADLQSNVKAMTAAMEETKQTALSNQRAELEAVMVKAREEFDITALEKTQKQLFELDQRKQAVPKPQGEPAVVAHFRTNNPAIDRNSPDFDADLNDLVEKRVNEKFQKVNPEAMTMADINELLTDAYESVKSKFTKYQPAKVKTPPKTRPQSTPKKAAGNNLTELTSSSRGMYDMLLETSGEDAAKTYLKNITKGKGE